MDKKYDFQKTEEALQEFWEREGIYQYQNGKERKTFSRKTFSVDTPPPTVSGKLHIGHVFSYTQAEIIARFKRMQGYNVFYPLVLTITACPPNAWLNGMKKSAQTCCPEAFSAPNACRQSGNTKRNLRAC